MTYLLDTNICIYLINKKPPIVLDRIRSKHPDEVAISTITIAELEYGVLRSKYPDQNRIALLEFLIPFSILDFDQIAATHYGYVRQELESKGKPIGPMDLLLAAQALSKNLIFVTNNEKEFIRIKNLRIENWAKK
jgi:tRNA(fMet)-specific endonuclease VapC